MNFSDVIDSYSRLDIVSKRNEIIKNLIVQVNYLKKMCDDKGIKYRKFNFSVNNDEFLTEEKFLEVLFFYTNTLSELNSKILQYYDD